MVGSVNSKEFLIFPGSSGRTAVLLPGFATDHRIFEGLFPDDDRIVPGTVGASRVADGLAAFLREAAAGPVTVFGWSLGAFAGAAFAAAHPERVSRLVLAGARRRYDRAGLDRFRRSLESDRESCLRDFYQQCFLPAQRAAYRRFRERLLSAYLREMDAGKLFEELEVLYASEIRPEKLPPGPVTFLHGAQDLIAPVAEARALAAEVPGATLHVLPDGGHAAFLAEAFAPLVEAE
jgi:pimeloyl-ACP methyl ester carboxylesterase